MITIPEADITRIAIWGDSISGAEVIFVGAIDPRVKAIVAQVSACGDETLPPDPDGLLFASIRETFLNGDVNSTPQTTTGPMPVVSFDQQDIPSLLTPLTAFRWFITPAKHVPFHPVLCDPYINAPLLKIVAKEDEMPGAKSRIARMAFAVVFLPKEMVEIYGGHFGLLHHPSPLFDQVSIGQQDFLA